MSKLSPTEFIDHGFAELHEFEDECDAREARRETVASFSRALGGRELTSTQQRFTEQLNRIGSPLSTKGRGFFSIDASGRKPD